MLGSFPMRSKDYKSLMSSSTFGQSTSNELILILIYHFKVIIFAQKSWRCLFYLHISLEDLKCLEVTQRSQKIIGHFTNFQQINKIIYFSLFEIFEWLFLPNVPWEVYFISSLKIKRKFWVEEKVWRRNIIGHF